MLTSLLLIAAFALQDPQVVLNSPVQPGKGSASVHGTAQVTFRGESMWSDWGHGGAWAIRDSAGKVHALDKRPRKRDEVALNGKPATVSLDLSGALAKCAPGSAELLFQPEPKGEYQPAASMTIAKEVTSKEIDFGDPEAFPDEELSKVRVQIDAAVDGEDVGTMTLEFWPDAAPNTVRNFVRYAAEGFYDGLGFHRVMPGFMIQGGCPKGTGTGQGPHGTIPAEFSKDDRRAHERGVVSMARSASPDSASCQFFICDGDAPFLDGQYASFGRLVDGEQTLDAIVGVGLAKSSSGEMSKPKQPCKIQKMHVLVLE